MSAQVIKLPFLSNLGMCRRRELSRFLNLTYFANKLSILKSLQCKPCTYVISIEGHYFITFLTLHVLYESTLTLHVTDVGSPEHRLQGIILDISSNRLFKAIRVCDSIETKNRPFLKIKFCQHQTRVHF